MAKKSSLGNERPACARPSAVRLVASGRGDRGSARRLRAVISEQEQVIDPEAFGRANRFHAVHAIAPVCAAEPASARSSTHR